jgi:hypothetical protein
MVIANFRTGLIRWSPSPADFFVAAPAVNTLTTGLD